MSKYENDKTFFESPLLMKENEGKRFIEDYGIDGEKLWLSGSAYQYQKKNNGYKTKGLLRLFCKDCPDKKCQGQNWDNCEYRIYLLISINKELARQNKELKEAIEKDTLSGIEKRQ